MRLAYKNDEISLYVIDSCLLTTEEIIKTLPNRAAAFRWQGEGEGYVVYVRFSDTSSYKIPIRYSSVINYDDLETILDPKGSEEKKQKLAIKIRQQIEILESKKKQIGIIDYAYCGENDEGNFADYNVSGQIDLLQLQFEEDHSLSVEAIDSTIKKIKNILHNLLDESCTNNSASFKNIVHACQVLARLEFIRLQPDNIKVFLIVNNTEYSLGKKRYVNPEAFLAMEEMLLPRVQELLDMFLTNDAIRPDETFGRQYYVGEDFHSMMTKLEQGEKLTPKQRVYLYPNVNVGDAGALRLAAVLRAGLAPENWRVYLHNNDITDVGVRALADELHHAPKGFLLELRENQININRAPYLNGRLASLFIDRKLPYNLRINISLPAYEAEELSILLGRNVVMQDRLACIAFHRMIHGTSLAAKANLRFFPDLVLRSIYELVGLATKVTYKMNYGLFANSIFNSSARRLSLAAQPASSEELDSSKEPHITHTL